MPWGCQEAFRTTLLEPFSLKKDEAAKVKSFKDSVPYIEEALGVYFREVEKQWKLFNTEKSWSPVGLEDAKLPKEAYRFKLTWFLKRISNICMLIPFLRFCAAYMCHGECAFYYAPCISGGFFHVGTRFPKYKGFDYGHGNTRCSSCRLL
ncbi:ADS_G0030790.mRNA.1.CDS.1 [Saccharomyces cerevisiae]|nr:ADS_G0030790.mRNA.1.CDS.1 [Saccharomyces cerevisiae]CAI6752712.1 ADS_G0030790.mRNA.1.CDS.1 [Saccharomyces cerevisiae]